MRNYKIDLSMLSKEKRVEVSKQIINIAVDKYEFRRPKECIGEKFLYLEKNEAYNHQILYGETVHFFNSDKLPEITWQDFLEKYGSSEEFDTINCRCTVIPKKIKEQLAFHKILNSGNVAMLEADIEGMKLPRREGYRKPAIIVDGMLFYKKDLKRKEVENIRIPDDGPIPYLIGWF